MCETKCLIIPKLDSKNFYILIFVLASLARRLVPKLVETIEDKTHEGKIDDKPPENFIYFFNIISNIFSDILSFIIILKNKCKKENNINNITTSEGEKAVKNMKKLFFILMPIIALTHFLGQLCLYAFYCIYKIQRAEDYATNEDLFFIIFFDILFRYIFSRILLNSYFYKHHYLSMVLNTIGFIPLLIISAKDIFEKNLDELYIISIYLLFYLIRVLLFSLEDVFIKIALNKLLLRPYHIMFYRALFQIIPLICISIPSIICLHKYMINISHYIIGFMINKIINIICCFLLNYSYITIIELVNPSHLSILKSLEFVAFYFLNMIWNIIESDEDIKYINYIFEFISCIILLFGALIHNEMIIIKICGFFECTDYYKTEVKGFSNIDIDYNEERNTSIRDIKDDNSFLANNSINNNENNEEN